MNRALIAVVVVLGLGLVGAVIYGIGVMKDKNTLATELQSLKSELASTQAELASTNNSLSATRSDLLSTRVTLTSTQSELTTTKNKLASTQSQLTTTNQTLTAKLVELNAANDKYASAQKSLATAQDSLTTTQKKLAAAQDTLNGLGITVASSAQCYDVQLVDNVTAKNPTWKELKDFLAADKTENHAYIPNVYDCSQFSQTLHNNAEAAGIRTAEVQVNFKNENVGHALDAFLTTDFGLIYVDCTGAPDKIANIVVGKEFRGVDLRWMASPANARNQSWWNLLSSYFYLPGKTGGHDVTSNILIFW
jgi:uncharacterized membrane-anchored protein YhcB (DUF1043 family)